MITVHHLNNSRSQRVLWLLEELKIPYDFKLYERDPKTLQAPESLRKVHPLGKAPVITDGKMVIAESGAIVEYLVETYGKGALKPKAGAPDSVRFSYWLHYAEGSAMPPLLISLVFNQILKTKMPFIIKPIVKGLVKNVRKAYINPQIKMHLDFMENELQKHTWFAGEEFTAADIQMSFPIEAALARGGLDLSRPKLMSFLERIHGRAGYKKALEKGGPYSLFS